MEYMHDDPHTAMEFSNDLLETSHPGGEAQEVDANKFETREDEELVSIEPVEMPPRPDERPESKAAFLRLLGADTEDQIGDHSPLAAAHNPDATDPAFNLYVTKFDRDGLCVCNKVEVIYPRLKRTTVAEYAEDQGIKDDPLSEEEPGRFPHEVRDPNTPIAQELTEKRGWGWPYYGSVDATLMWINAFTDCAKDDPDYRNTQYQGRDNETHTLQYALDQAVGWVERKTDSNPDGLVEFKTSNNRGANGGGIEQGGIENQVWKDSPDAYHHKDGTLANHDQGIASVEVQGLAYDALLNAADFYEATLADSMSQEEREAAETKITGLRARAETLKATVMEHFWVEDEQGGYFALGTDRDESGALRPMEIRTSNMGLLLNSRLLDGDDPEIVRRREATVETLFSENMLSDYGIRTLASDEVRYRPGAYHNGSVWPKDTHDIAVGLARHGYFALARELNRRTEQIFEETHQFPELVRSDADGTPERPIITDHIVRVWDETLQWENRVEEPPQPDQAWTIAAAVAIEYENGTWPAEAADPAMRQFEEELLEKVAGLEQAA